MEERLTNFVLKPGCIAEPVRGGVHADEVPSLVKEGVQRGLASVVQD